MKGYSFVAKHRDRNGWIRNTHSAGIDRTAKWRRLTQRANGLDRGDPTMRIGGTGPGAFAHSWDSVSEALAAS